MVERARVGVRLPFRSRFVEFVSTLGPASIGGEVRDVWDLLSDSWGVSIGVFSGEVSLWQLVGEDWVRVRVPGHPLIDSVVPGSFRRVSLAFDQLGFPAVAVQSGASEFVVSQWDPVGGEYVLRGPFVGVDPFLVNDVLWSLDSAASDLLVFFLGVDRLSLGCRVQRDVFSVEYFPFGEDLDSVSSLERVVPLWYQYGVLLSDGGDLFYSLVSEPYDFTFPVEGDGVVVGSSLPSGGEYLARVVTEGVGVDGIGVSGALPSGGEYFLPTVDEDLGVEGISVSGALPSDGEYFAPILDEDVGLEGISVDGVLPVDGEYFSPISREDLGVEGVSVSGVLPVGGSYEKP